MTFRDESEVIEVVVVDRTEVFSSHFDRVGPESVQVDFLAHSGSDIHQVETCETQKKRKTLINRVLANKSEYTSCKSSKIRGWAEDFRLTIMQWSNLTKCGLRG